MTAPRWDVLLTGARLATFAGDTPFGLIDDGALAIAGDRIAWVGRRAELASSGFPPAVETIDLGGALVTPGLIDCHTHLVFGGQRAREFDMRLHGASYETIARAGGGIVSTVTATRAASENELLASASMRARASSGSEGGSSSRPGSIPSSRSSHRAATTTLATPTWAP